MCPQGARPGLQQPEAGFGLHPVRHAEHRLAVHEAVGVEDQHVVVVAAPALAEVLDVAGFAAGVLLAPTIEDPPASADPSHQRAARQFEAKGFLVLAAPNVIRSLVEEEHLRAPMQYGGIEVIRQQVTTSSIRAAAGFLGSIKEGRKSLVLISETLGPTRGTTE